MQMVAERLGITDQFLGVDEIKLEDAGSLVVKERIEGGKHQVSRCAGAPAMLGWATGNLPEPPNHPQVGMPNMRLIMPALQKAKAAALTTRLSTTRASACRNSSARPGSSRTCRPTRSRARLWSGSTK